MKKTHALVVVSFAAVAVGAAIASCTSFSSGDNGGQGGAGGDTTGGGTGGMTTTGNGGSTDTGAGGSTTTGGGGSTTTGAGGTTGTAGAAGAGPGTGGRTGTGGTTTGAGGTTTGAGGTVASTSLPCDILNAAGNTCVAAHSTIRLLNSKYTGPLYQVCKGATALGPNACTGGAAAEMDIPQLNGYADSSVQNTFCAGAVCSILTIYDQSGMGNLLRPSPKGGHSQTANGPAIATALPTKAGGHNLYGVYIRQVQGYRAGCTQCAIAPGPAKGVATGDMPETEYMVTSQNKLIDGCCFDYGNAETDSIDDKAGTMEAVYFGGGVVWGTGAEGGHSDSTNPWVMADLEDGLYAGWSTTLPPSASQQIVSNTALHFNFVTALIIGDTADKNAGKGRFAIMGGDATSASPLKVMYDGIRPTTTGYNPSKKQGSIILGTGGDNSNTAEGYFYEGVMAQGAASTATLAALQASIAAAKYGQ